MKSKVYYSKEITPESLIKVYEALGVELPGRVGIKVSTGEDGAKGYLKADLIAPFVQKLNGTILECNTAYPGKRTSAKEHYAVAKKHGFNDFAEVDIMDEKGDFKIHAGQHSVRYTPTSDSKVYYLNIYLYILPYSSLQVLAHYYLPQ